MKGQKNLSFGFWCFLSLTFGLSWDHWRNSFFFWASCWRFRCTLNGFICIENHSSVWGLLCREMYKLNFLLWNSCSSKLNAGLGAKKERKAPMPSLAKLLGVLTSSKGSKVKGRWQSWPAFFIFGWDLDLKSGSCAQSSEGMFASPTNFIDFVGLHSETFPLTIFLSPRKLEFFNRSMTLGCPFQQKGVGFVASWGTLEVGKSGQTFIAKATK